MGDAGKQVIFDAAGCRGAAAATPLNLLVYQRPLPRIATANKAKISKRYCLIVASLNPTIEVSDRRRQGRWSARGASEQPPGLERTSGAAVRSTDWFGVPVAHHSKLSGLLCPTRREGRPARDEPNSHSLRTLGVRTQTNSGHTRQVRHKSKPKTAHPRLTRTHPPND